MWNIWSQMGSGDPKFGPMHKASYHTSPVQSLIGSYFNPVPNKQFSYFKCNTNPSFHICQNYSNSSSSEMNSSQEKESKIMVHNNTSNNKKKRKKRRRRNRRNKNQQKMTPVKEEKPRQRQISIAESEDSFVIFFDHSEPSDNETETTDHGSSDCIVPEKKVRFAADSELCEVHPMVVWSYAYQAARKGPWEEYARDRCWFSNRIVKTEALIGHVFKPEHRSRIYEDRFA